MTSSRSLAVFVPALNEESHLRETIETILRALAVTTTDYEILIVDDGSTDRTPEIADRLVAANPSIRVLHNKSRSGLGRGYRSAVSMAGKAHFVFIPGDNSWPYESIRTLFENLGRADIITSYPTNFEVERSTGRRLVSRIYTLVLNLLHGLDLHYYNGLTIYPTEYLKATPILGSGFGFAAEMLLGAMYRGMSVFEIGLPIQERVGGRSKAITPRNIASVLRSVLRAFWIHRITGSSKASAVRRDRTR